MRWRHSHKNKYLGFSLVELMAAVAIVSILVGLALPRFRAFIARSRMAEAKTNLGILATLGQSYQLEYGSCCPPIAMGNTSASPDLGCSTSGCSTTDGSGQKNLLGFRVVAACTELKYCYTGATDFSAKADANQIYPGGGCTSGAIDEWEITAQRKLSHGSSAIKQCTGN